MKVCYQHAQRTLTLTATHLCWHLTYRAVRGIHESYSIKPVYNEAKFKAFWFPGNRSLSLASNVNALGLAIHLETLKSYPPILFLMSLILTWAHIRSATLACRVCNTCSVSVMWGNGQHLFGKAFLYGGWLCHCCLASHAREQSRAPELYLILVAVIKDCARFIIYEPQYYR